MRFLRESHLLLFRNGPEVEGLDDLLQLLPYLYMLRADPLAFPAPYAFIRTELPMGCHQPFGLTGCELPVTVESEIVQSGERTGDPDVLRAHLRAIIAGCALHDIDRFQSVACLAERLVLLLGQALETPHQGDVLVHLTDVAHAGKDDGNSIVIRGEAQRP